MVARLTVAACVADTPCGDKLLIELLDTHASASQAEPLLNIVETGQMT